MANLFSTDRRWSCAGLNFWKHGRTTRETKTKTNTKTRNGRPRLTWSFAGFKENSKKRQSDNITIIFFITTNINVIITFKKLLF